MAHNIEPKTLLKEEDLDGDSRLIEVSRPIRPESILQLPSRWIGKYQNLVNPRTHFEVVNLSKVNISIAQRKRLVSGLKFLGQEVHRSTLKFGGHAQFKLMKMLKYFGMADSLINDSIDPGGRMMPIAYEASSILASNICKGKMLNVALVGDSSDGLAIGLLTVSQIRKVKLNWFSIQEFVGYEGTLRNYFYQCDAVYSLKESHCLSIVLNNDMENILDTLASGMSNFFEGTLDLILLNATGDEVLNDHAVETPSTSVIRAMKWLEIVKIACVVKITKGLGKLIVRTNLNVLTDVRFVVALSDLINQFKECQLVAPALGVDVGIIYIILFSPKHAVDDETKGTHPLINWDEDSSQPCPTVCSLISQLLNFLEGSVISYVQFIDSMVGMANIDDDGLNELSKLLKEARPQNGIYLPVTNEYFERKIVSSLYGTRGYFSILLRWHNKIPLQHEVNMIAPLHQRQTMLDKMSINCNVYRALKATMSRDTAINVISQLSRLRTRTWRYANSPYIRIMHRKCLPDEAEIQDLSVQSRYEIIWSSRWCRSALVPIRGALKKILITDHDNLDMRCSRGRCIFCKDMKGNKLSFLEKVKTKISTDDVQLKIAKIIMNCEANTESFVYECFVEDLESFSTLNDMQCAHNRVKKIMNTIKSMRSGDSMYLCSYLLLSRFELGFVHLMSLIFEDVYLIGTNKRPVAYGVLLNNFKSIHEVVFPLMNHIQSCIDLSLPEVEKFESLDFAMGSTYLDMWLSYLLYEALKIHLFNLMVNDVEHDESDWNEIENE